MKKKSVKHKSRKKKAMKLPWKKVIIVAIIIIILLAGFFIVRGVVNTRSLNAFSNGVQYGYANAVYEIMNLSLSCQPVPVYVGNVTMNLVNVDCLQPR